MGLARRNQRQCTFSEKIGRRLQEGRDTDEICQK
jgi:hypothetical protein